MACDMRLKSPDRRRPVPGEIRQMAWALLDKGPRVVVDNDKPHAPPNDEEREKMARVGAMVTKVAKSRSMPIWHADNHTLAYIIQTVALVCGLTPEQVKSESRRAELVEARFIVIGLARRHTAKSITAIGAALGRDHTTILYGAERCEELLKDPGFSELYDRCEGAL